MSDKERALFALVCWTGILGIPDIQLQALIPSRIQRAISLRSQRCVVSDYATQ